MTQRMLCSLVLLICAAAFGAGAASPDVRIAMSVLPLPERLRAGAAVVRFEKDGSSVMLRKGTNGMVCFTVEPGEADIDARCYHESFMPVIERIRVLRSQGVKRADMDRNIDQDVKSGKLKLPEHPCAGYRILAPARAYNEATNVLSAEASSWQSIHIPYRTATEMGLMSEDQVDEAARRVIPYVMSSGTFWSHVMIEHPSK